MFSAIITDRGARMRAAKMLMQTRDYRYEPLLSGYRDDGVVTVGPPRGWVNENVDAVIDERRGERLSKHDVDVLRLKGLLKGVEGKPGKLGLDKVGPVLHDSLELHVAVSTLPPAPQCERRELWNVDLGEKHLPRHQVEHVDAVRGPALSLARSTRELDAQKCEDGLPCQLVPHLHEPCVKVDLAGERADGEQRGRAHDGQGRDGFLSSSSSSDDCEYKMPAWASAYVKESWVDVGSLLENNDIPAGALGRRNLPKARAPASRTDSGVSDAEWEKLDNSWESTRVF